MYPAFRPILFAGVLGVLGCSTSPTTQPGSASSGSSPPQTDFTVKSADLAEEFEKDRVAASARYRGKTLLVKGPVHLVEPGLEGHRLVLKGAPVPFAGGIGHPIACLFGDDALEKVSTFTPGQSVTVTGTFKLEDGVFVHLTDCQLREAGPDPAIAVLANDLAKAFATDKQVAQKKYIGKWLLVEGDLVSVGKDAGGDFNRVTVMLDGYKIDGGEVGITFVCGPYGSHDEPALQARKPGEKVKLKGLCSAIKSPGQVQVYQAKLVK